MPESRKYADRAEYLKKAVSLRRKKIRQMLVEYKGGKCELCGYNECIDVLDLHHKDPLVQRNLASPLVASQGLGRKTEPKPTNAFYCAQTAIERFTQATSSLLG